MKKKTKNKTNKQNCGLRELGSSSMPKLDSSLCYLPLLLDFEKSEVFMRKT